MLKKFITRTVDSTSKLLIKRPLVSLFMDSRFLFHYEMLRKSASDSVDFAANNFQDAMYFYDDKSLWSYVSNKFNSLSKAESNKIIVAEFGVWKGRSINYFAKQLPNALIFGFDSFEGFAQDWSGTSIKKGDFSLFKKMPKVETNVTLTKGWFEDTVPGFVYQLNGSQIFILHMDADIYEPTKLVLSSLSGNIRKGTIIVFDQFFGYVNFKNHEFKAWIEFASAQNMNYAYIAFTDRQVAIEIL